MKRGAVLVAIAIAVVIAWWWTGSDRSRKTETSTSTSTEKSEGGKAPGHVTQVGAEERKRAAEAIAHKHAARHTSTPRPELPAPEPELKTSIRDAMHEVIPFLTDCYDKARPTLPNAHVEVTAQLTLTGDPDVGTLIDADQIFDKQTGQPLPHAFDDCLRATMQTLELPALAEGDVVTVHYPFVFDTQPQ